MNRPNKIHLSPSPRCSALDSWPQNNLAFLWYQGTMQRFALLTAEMSAATKLSLASRLRCITPAQRFSTAAGTSPRSGSAATWPSSTWPTTSRRSSCPSWWGRSSSWPGYRISTSSCRPSAPSGRPSCRPRCLSSPPTANRALKTETNRAHSEMNLD